MSISIASVLQNRADTQVRPYVCSGRRTHRSAPTSVPVGGHTGPPYDVWRRRKVLPPDPIALLAGPARWRWIAQCEGEFVVPLGWHGARRLRDHLLNDQLVLSLLELGFG